jgi:hypothetical protein
VLEILILTLTTFFKLDFGNVPTVWYILFSILLQSHNVETDPPNTIHEITNTYPNHAESPFYGKQKIKPMAKLVFTKTKEVCKSKEADDSSEDTNNIQLHDRSHSWLCTDISIGSGGILKTSFMEPSLPC